MRQRPPEEGMLLQLVSIYRCFATNAKPSDHLFAASSEVGGVVGATPSPETASHRYTLLHRCYTQFCHSVAAAP